jgi:uncharacterized membrane protein
MVRSRVNGRLTLKLKRDQLVVFGSIGILIIVVALAIGYHNAIDRQLRSWKLLPEPERLTELYFTHPNSLPTTYVPGQPQTVSFTVHNLEYRDTMYQYVISEVSQDNGQSQVLNSGNFNLQQNGYHTEAVNISTSDLGPRVKLEVDLKTVNESIDYLLHKEGS